MLSPVVVSLPQPPTLCQFAAMNPLPREEHTLFAGRYYSSPTSTLTDQPQHLVTSVTNIFAIRGAIQTNTDAALLTYPLQVNPLQFLNDGLEANYASQHLDPPHQKVHRRFSLLWKPNNNEHPKNSNTSIPHCHNPSLFQRNPSGGFFGFKRNASPAIHHVDLSQLENTDKHYFRRLSWRFVKSDSSKLTQQRSLHENTEILTLFEDDFIAFACRKDNNLIHKNFVTRAVANIGNKVLQSRHRH